MYHVCKYRLRRSPVFFFSHLRGYSRCVAIIQSLLTINFYVTFYFILLGVGWIGARSFFPTFIRERLPFVYQTMNFLFFFFYVSITFRVLFSLLAKALFPQILSTGEFVACSDLVYFTICLLLFMAVTVLLVTFL